jgi:hypothetical protein
MARKRKLTEYEKRIIAENNAWRESFNHKPRTIKSDVSNRNRFRQIKLEYKTALELILSKDKVWSKITEDTVTVDLNNITNKFKSSRLQIVHLLSLFDLYLEYWSEYSNNIVITTTKRHLFLLNLHFNERELQSISLSLLNVSKQLMNEEKKSLTIKNCLKLFGKPQFKKKLTSLRKWEYFTKCVI